MQSIIGHKNAKELLQRAVEQKRIGHAYIFEGKSGIGRLSLAKAFAQEIVGSKGNFSSLSHPDIIVVTNELYDTSKKKASVSVDTIRAMKADVYIKPYMAEKKVYIIPKADTMQAPAQNSILKVFEEPPEYCTIILIAENANSFLPTILSRATVLRLRPLLTQEVESYLASEKGIDADDAKALSLMSGGSIGTALMLLENDDIIGLRAELTEHLIRICDNGYKPLYDFIKFLKQNQPSIKLILDLMSGWVSDIMHIKLRFRETEEVLNADKKAELKMACSVITRAAAFHLEEIVAKYSLAISRNANYQIAVQCMATEYWEEIHGRNYRSAL